MMESIRPQAPCEKCLADPKATWSNGKITMVYCHHNLSGVVFNSDSKRWTCYSPMTLADWGEFVLGFLYGLKLEIEGRLEKEMNREAANA